MPSHTFNTQAGSLATGGTGGGSAQVTGSVTVEKVRDVSEGTGLQNAQIAYGSSIAAADTDLQVIFKRPTTTQVQLRIQDDSSASGPGAATDFDTAQANNPTSGTDLYNDLSGAVEGPNGTGSIASPGTFRWTVAEYQDGEGMTEHRLEIWWNGTRVHLQLIGGDAVTSKTVGAYTYTPGSTYASNSTTTHKQVSRTIPTFSAYAFNSNVGTITAIRMKVTVSAMTNTAGSVAPLRTLAGTPLASGSNDSGWITSNLSDGITLDIQHKPTTATTPSDNATYTFVAEVELWARASGVSDTKLKDFGMSATTIVDI